MVKIRLARFGKKKQPTYRVVVSDVRKDTLGTYIESIGHYNPSITPKEIVIDAERAQHWLAQGAQPTAVVHNMLVDQKIIDTPKRSASPRYVPKAEATEEETQASDAAPEEAAADTDVPADDTTETAEEKTEEKEEKEEKSE